MGCAKEYHFLKIKKALKLRALSHDEIHHVRSASAWRIGGRGLT